MKTRVFSVILVAIALVAATIYVGTSHPVRAQSTAASKAIVNAAGCNLSYGAHCTLTLNWPSSFSDSNYAALCNINLAQTGSSTPFISNGNIWIEGKTASSITVYIQNPYNYQTSTSENCVGIHN